MEYYISDTHFGHANVIGMCGRPFSNVHEMDETLIENWNRKVNPGDTVYILGDLIYKSRKDPHTYLKRLRGRKILITGNHDSWIEREGVRAEFLQVSCYHLTRLSGHPATLCHYPMLEWQNSRKEGSPKLGFLLHGHIHNSRDELYRRLFDCGNAWNAGADINQFEPVNWDELERNNEDFKLSLMADPLDQARYLCRAYHQLQHDRYGAPYAGHARRVAAAFSDPTRQIAALLHDAPAMTRLRPDRIRALFGARVHEAICALMPQDGESCSDLLRRILSDPVAVAVKRADLLDEADPGRCRGITDPYEQTIRDAREQLALLDRLLAGEG